MGASAAASAAFGGGGNSAIGTTQAGQLAQQLNAMRRRGGLFSNIAELVNQGPQVGTAEQQDPNNLSATGFGGVVTQNNNMMNPSEAQLATGNAPENTLTAGMAVGNAPIATAGNFNPQTEFAAAQMFGNGTQFVKPKKLINL